MKFTFYKAFLCLVGLLLFVSCEKDAPLQQPEKNITQIYDQSSLRGISDKTNFFDIHYLFNSLGLKSNMNGYVSGVNEIIDFYSSNDLENSSIGELETNGIWPCWYCSEADHFDALNYYTPLYNINSKVFEGLLITRKNDERLMSVLITKDLVSAMATTSNDNLFLYIDRVMQYFKDGVTGKDIRDYSASKKRACLVSEYAAQCTCTGEVAYDCSDYGPEPVGLPDCLPSCGDDGGGSGNNTPNEDPYSDDDGDDSSGPGSCFFCGTYSVNGGESGSGGGPPSSQFDIIERQQIVTSILEYIDQYTNIYINLGNILALSNETHFDYTTYLLYENMESMTVAQIEAYLLLITVHRHFITDAMMSSILLFDSGLCNDLNDFFIDNNSNDLSYKYGRVITFLSNDNMWPDLISNSQLLMDLEASNTLLSFSDSEIEHMLTFEPELIADIQDFIKDHPNDPLAIEVIHDFIDLQQCDATDPCVHTNYDNELEVVYSFYSSMSSEVLNWVSLETNRVLKYNILDLIIAENFEAEELHYALWAIKNFGNNLEYYLNNLNEFTGDNPAYNPPVNEVIDIINSYVPTTSPSAYPTFAETPYRSGHEYDPINGIIPEDMRSGMNGDITLLSSWFPNRRELLNLSNQELLQGLRDLLHHNELNSDLQIVATDYYNKWETGTEDYLDYYNSELSAYVLNNDHMITTVKDFGLFLNNQLKIAEGKIDSVTMDNFGENYRVIFNTGEKTTGLKILINDTEKLVVKSIGDFTFDITNNEWQATFYFQVFDNFGLDDEDLKDFQGTRTFNLGPKFASWWILQHIRGYKPFRTEIRNVFKIKGDLDK